MVLDESMSSWRPKTIKFGGLPNITYKARKPKPLGTMFKNGVKATRGGGQEVENQQGQSQVSALLQDTRSEQKYN